MKSFPIEKKNTNEHVLNFNRVQRVTHLHVYLLTLTVIPH